MSTTTTFPTYQSNEATVSPPHIINELQRELQRLEMQQFEYNERLAVASQKSKLWANKIYEKTRDMAKLKGVMSEQCEAFVSALQMIEKKSFNITESVKILNSSINNIQVALILIRRIKSVQSAAAIAVESIKTGAYETAAAALATYDKLLPHDTDSSAIMDGCTLPSEGDIPEERVLAQQLLHILEQSDKPILETFKSVRQQLVVIVKNEFQKSIAQNDKEGVARFSKLLYPLGIEDEGIQRYIQFIRNVMNDQCAANFRALIDPFRGLKDEGVLLNVPYAEILTNVFVAVADLIQEHKENIEVEFGSTNFILFCRGLQEEADVQGMRILDKFCSDRSSVLQIDAISNNPSRATLRNLDGVLQEVVMLSKRCQQFNSYIRNCSSVVLETLPSNSELREQLQQESKYSKSDGLLTLSLLNQKMQSLVGTYVTLEHFRMQRAVKQAADETDEVTVTDVEQMTSTMSEDIFYIFQESLSRALSSADVYVACAMVNHVISLLSVDVKMALETKLKSSRFVYLYEMEKCDNLTKFNLKNSLEESANLCKENNSVLGSAFSWTHSINNLVACMEYITLLKEKCEREFDVQFAFKSKGNTEDEDLSMQQTEGSYKMMFQHTLSGLEGIKVDFDAMHLRCCKITLNVLKDMIFPYLAPLESTSFDINDAEYADYQVNDPFAKTFISALAAVHKHLSTYYNPSSAEQCIQLLATKVAKAMEMAVLKKRFTLLGGMQFYLNLRSIIQFFASISDQSIRSKFSRLIEISDLYTLESLQELKELHGPSILERWKLTPEEIRLVLSCRTDFNATDIASTLDELAHLRPSYAL